MTKLAWMAACGLWAISTIASAQDLRVEPRRPISVATATSTAPTISTSSQLPPTQEMWFYEQAKREHLDPRAAVRRKAEFETAQRQNRMAASAWFGVSNSRPMCSVTPNTSDYGPTWGSNSADQYIWGGNSSGPSTVMVGAPFRGVGGWYW